MSLSRNILMAMCAFSVVLVGSAASGQETTPPDARAPDAADSAPYTGPLQRSPSPTYYPLGSSTLVRSGPTITAQIITTLNGQSQALKALGMFVAPNVDAYGSNGEDTSLSRTWIKVKAPSGQTGFVSLADLITPKQLESRKQSDRKIAVLASDIEQARRTMGGTIPSGIYSHGNVCEGDSLTGAALSNFLASKFLLWQEDTKLHYVQIITPQDPLIYDQKPDAHPIEIQNFGYIMIQTFQSSRDAAFMGYKDKRLWLSADGNNFDNYRLCGPETFETMLTLLKDYASQRPPDTFPLKRETR